MDRRIITIFSTAVFRNGTHFVGTEQCHDRRDDLHKHIILKVCNDVIAVKSSLPITKERVPYSDYSNNTYKDTK
jgi:hypothetical protein